MSARRRLIAALAEDSLGGIATLEDVARAEQLVDSHRTEVIAKAIGRLRAIPVTCTALTGPVWYGDGWNSAITQLEEIAEYQTPDDEAYPGELQRLRALVLGLRVAALRKGDMARVQWLLTDHEETRKKATATPAATATSQGPVFDPLPSYLHAIGQAGSETERALHAAYVQAIAEVARLQAETDDGQPPAGEATPNAATRQARLLARIREEGGHWKSGRAVRTYGQLGYSGSVRTARFDLAVLRDAGHLTQHDETGVRFYTFNPQKGSSS